jgi:Mrp family chromosome partitioning ATPase
VTKIYGTPPAPELEQQAKALRTTQAYGSPPAALAKGPPPIPNETPFPAEVLPPLHRNSIPPEPMTQHSRPPITPAPPPRSSIPTSYSYVQTPVPEAHSIPQTPHPARPSPPPPARTPSPPPRTQPYGSLPPVEPRRTPPVQPGVATSVDAAPPANLPKTPNPPAPALAAPKDVVRSHPVSATWRPNDALSPARRREIAGEILTLALERCFVVGVTGLRGSAEEKSKAAAEIALALADARHPRVLVMESDFNFPKVQKWLNIDVPLATGFSQQLRARIQGTKEGRWHVIECKPSLHALAEGVVRSPGLLLSTQFEGALRELRGFYDVIVIDAPVAPSEADGSALADVVDGAVVVGPSNRASEIIEVSKAFTGKALLRAIEG